MTSNQPDLTPAAKPSRRQFLAYLAGRRLPDELHDWVIQDVTGPGATRRYALRFIIPFTPVFVALLLVPGPWGIRIGMVMLLLLPFLYFLFALKNIYLRHRLATHGLDISLLNAAKRPRLDREKASYESRYRD